MSHSPKTEGQLRAWHWRTGQPHSTVRTVDPQWNLELMFRRLIKDVNFRDVVKLSDCVSGVFTGGEKAAPLQFDALSDGLWKVSMKATTEQGAEIWVCFCYERNFRMAVERICDRLNPMGGYGHGYTTACVEASKDGMLIDPLVIWKYEDAERAMKEAGNALACEVTGYFEQVPEAMTNRGWLNDLSSDLPKKWVGQRKIYEMMERIEDLNPTVRQPVKRKGMAEEGEDSQTEGWFNVIRPGKT